MPTARRGLLRRVTADDFPRLYAIWTAVDEHRFRDDWETFAATAMRFMTRGRTWVWSDVGGIIHGFAAAAPASGEIEAIYVHPDAQSRGIGRALLRKCCDDLLRRGHRHAWLVTSPGTKAEQIYRDAGWLPDGSEPSGAVRLRKRLIA